MFWDKEGAEELVGKVDPSFIAVSSAAKGESVDQLPTLGMLLGLLDGFVVHHSCRPLETCPTHYNRTSLGTMS